MSVALPDSLDGALSLLADDPSAQPLAGGTDLMVEVNYGHRRPTSVVSLRRVDELRGWRRDGDTLVLGAGLRYTEMLEPDFVAVAPALAQAARTVGSPQIRSTGTIGGNVATASPAGDTLPVLAALDARLTVASASGIRHQAIADFVTGVKRTTLAPGELITEIRVPAAAGPQEFLKIGTRNAMVISVASAALVVDWQAQRRACALGSVSPRLLRCDDAEAYIATRVDWQRRCLESTEIAEEFGRRCAAAATPIDDHRSTAAYRRHAVGVLARRALVRAIPGGSND